MTAGLLPEGKEYHVDGLGCKFVVLGEIGHDGFVRTSAGATIGGAEGSEQWQEKCKRVAANLMAGREPLSGSLLLAVTFYLPRPPSHRAASGLRRRDAPKYPGVRPVVLGSMTQTLESTLTGTVWKRPAQVVTHLVRKRYGTPARTEVQVVIEI